MAREKTYKADVAALVAAGGSVKDVVLESKVKATGETVTVNTKEYAVSNLPQALAFCGGSEQELWTLFTSRVVNPMAQANDRRELAILAEGPDKVIADLIKSFVKTGVADNEADAAEAAVALMVKKGKVPEGYVYKA